MANIRSAYAEVAALALEDSDNTHTATVTKQQKQDDWQTSGSDSMKIAGVTVDDINSTPDTVLQAVGNNLRISGTDDSKVSSLSGFLQLAYKYWDRNCY